MNRRKLWVVLKGEVVVLVALIVDQEWNVQVPAGIVIGYIVIRHNPRLLEYAVTVSNTNRPVTIAQQHVVGEHKIIDITN
jgi:hypothetical protein